MGSSEQPVSLERLKAMLGTQIQTLPCLPPVLLGVQKAITEGEVGARELAHVILADPSLTAVRASRESALDAAEVRFLSAYARDLAQAFAARPF